MKPEAVFFPKFNKIDNLLTKLIKRERERTQKNKIRNESGEITPHKYKGL